MVFLARAGNGGAEREPRLGFSRTASARESIPQGAALQAAALTSWPVLLRTPELWPPSTSAAAAPLSERLKKRKCAKDCARASSSAPISVGWRAWRRGDRFRNWTISAPRRDAAQPAAPEPTAAVPEEFAAAPAIVATPAAATGLPWENREQLGWLNALIETMQMVLLRPKEAFAVMRREGGLIDPLLYTLIMGMLGAVISFVFSFGLRSFGMGSQNGLGALLGAGAVVSGGSLPCRSSWSLSRSSFPDYSISF